MSWRGKQRVFRPVISINESFFCPGLFDEKHLFVLLASTLYFLKGVPETRGGLMCSLLAISVLMYWFALNFFYCRFS